MEQDWWRMERINTDYITNEKFRPSVSTYVIHGVVPLSFWWTRKVTAEGFFRSLFFVQITLLFNSFFRRTLNWGCLVWSHWNRTRILARYHSRMCYKRRWVRDSFHFLRYVPRLYQGKIEYFTVPFSCCQTKVKSLRHFICLRAVRE